MDSAYWAKCDKEFEKAEIYYNKKNYKKALTSYIELVQKGYPAAYYRIGEFYSKGLNLKKRDDLAAQFFENGAALGMPECYYELATMYRNGIHYEVDREMEIEMLELATALSEPKSTILLSRYLLEGEITEKDTTRAHELLRKEAIRGNADANYELSLLMECMSVERDSILGSPFECMERAVKNGSHKAMWWMVQYEESKGNYREAYTLAKELYLHRNIDATMYLAGCFLHGKGIDRDRRLAKDLYREAAKAGNSEAKRILEEW
jgi:TPR repeat protein